MVCRLSLLSAMRNGQSLSREWLVARRTRVRPSLQGRWRRVLPNLVKAVAVVEGAVGKEEEARRDGVGLWIEKRLAPAIRGFDEQRALFQPPPVSGVLPGRVLEVGRDL